MGFLKTAQVPVRQTESPAFNLSNPYHFTFLKGGTSFVGTDKPLFQKQIKAAKILQPCLHLNEGRGLKFLSFDFDTKDPAVHAAVWAKFSGWAIVFKSPSGNVKALVPVSGYADKELGLEERRAYITATLERLGISHICIPDLSAGALNLCFVSEEAYRAMQGYWADGQPVLTREQFERVVPKLAPVAASPAAPVVQPKFQYFQVTKDTFTPSLMYYIKRTTRGTQFRLKLVQILVATWNLAGTTQGFGLSSKVLAEQIGCSHTFILNELQELQDRKLLECCDEEHCYVGYKAKAKSYVALGALEQEINKHKKEGGKRIGRLPESIADGNWFYSIQVYVNKFNNLESFLAWIGTVPGAHLKDRHQKAVSWGRIHFRNKRLRGLYDHTEEGS